MVKVMYNDKLGYKVVIWVFFGISLWKEKEALSFPTLLIEKVTRLMDAWTVRILSVGDVLTPWSVYVSLGQTLLICCFSYHSWTHFKESKRIIRKTTVKVGKQLHENIKSKIGKAVFLFYLLYTINFFPTFFQRNLDHQ